MTRFEITVPQHEDKLSSTGQKEKSRGPASPPPEVRAAPREQPAQSTTWAAGPQLWGCRTVQDCGRRGLPSRRGQRVMGKARRVGGAQSSGGPGREALSRPARAVGLGWASAGQAGHSGTARTWDTGARPVGKHRFQSITWENHHPQGHCDFSPLGERAKPGATDGKAPVWRPAPAVSAGCPQGARWGTGRPWLGGGGCPTRLKGLCIRHRKATSLSSDSWSAFTAASRQPAPCSQTWPLRGGCCGPWPLPRGSQGHPGDWRGFRSF